MKPVENNCILNNYSLFKMRYTIECSFGEIVDKYTILQIKRKKVKNPAQKKNIDYEYNLLKAQIKNPDPLFDKLLKINQKLCM